MSHPSSRDESSSNIWPELSDAYTDPNTDTVVAKSEKPKYWLHLLLFLITLGTTTLAGLEWISPSAALSLHKGELSWAQFTEGFWFSIPFLGILTVHEFGHYGVARIHKAAVTLPYYIPMYLGWLGALSIGTMGAFIRIKSPLSTRRALFDVGAAGPLAGYAAILLVLGWGYTHLPPPDYIFTIHPEYIPYGLNYADKVYASGQYELIRVGGNATTWLLERLAVPANIPNPYEMMHYPLLFAGYMALFFTALNLFPIGQLDGGHILYGLVGPAWHARLSPLFFLMLVAYSGIGVIQPMRFEYDPDLWEKLRWNGFYLLFLYISLSRVSVDGPAKRLNHIMLTLSIFALHYGLAAFAPQVTGFNGWLIFCLVLGRFLGVHHPPVLHDEPLNPARMVIGCISLAVFAMSFSPQPFGFD